MALTQTDLDRLDAAIASSELEVEVDGHRRRYRSMNELMAARAHIASVLSTSPASGRTAGMTFRPTFTTQRD